MRTTLSFGGAIELILEKAVNLGLAKSKTDALRLSVFSFNKEYNLVKDFEMEMVESKLKKEEEEVKRKGIKFIPKNAALAKYR